MSAFFHSKNPDPSIIYCLLCYKPQDNLTRHLARTCMKNKTAEQRRAEAERANESMERWSCSSRNWDYNEICRLMPHKPSRLAFLEELLRRGYFVDNVPNDEDLTVDQKQPSAVESPPRVSGSQTPNSGSACQTPRNSTCQR